jgi:hypothetical protein
MSEERTERFAAESAGEPTQEPTRVGEVVGESYLLRHFKYVSLLSRFNAERKL